MGGILGRSLLSSTNVHPRLNSSQSEELYCDLPLSLTPLRHFQMTRRETPCLPLNMRSPTLDSGSQRPAQSNLPPSSVLSPDAAMKGPRRGGSGGPGGGAGTMGFQEAPACGESSASQLPSLSADRTCWAAWRRAGDGLGRGVFHCLQRVHRGTLAWPARPL